MTTNVHTDNPPRQFSVVAVVCSAGGVEALLNLLARLPREFPVPFVIAHHLRPGRESRLVEVLSRQTPLEVRWAQDGDKLKAGIVFVGKPGHHTMMRRGHIRTVPMREGVYPSRLSGDLLMASSAVEFGTAALGIVMTGCLNDGANGSQVMRRFGGAVLVQDPESALFADMPRATIKTGAANFVLPLRVLASALITLVMRPGASELFCPVTNN